jgi:hypothetical protein
MQIDSENINIMLDLETWGVKAGCPIVSIGAVAFSETRLIDGFYQAVQPSSNFNVGLNLVCPLTLMWWMKQEEKVRLESVSGTHHIYAVLRDFSNYVTQTKNRFDGANLLMWGNCVDFDNAILAKAYDICGVDLPWDHFNNRSFRTVRNEWPEVGYIRPPEGEAHNALKDAEYQAVHLQKIWHHKKDLLLCRMN